MRQNLRLIFLWIVFVVAWVCLAAAAEPPTEAMLRVDPGMHTAMIRRIAIGATGKNLVTASDDKSLRVWELPSGRLVRTIRPPIGKGHEGKFFSVAISPDDRTIAAGGWTQFNNGEGVMAVDGQNIYLFDRVSGDMTGHISGLFNVILHLSFSPDGKWLVATMKSGGIRIYCTSGWFLVAEDKEYGSDSYSAEFYRDGRLVTTCYDGFIRLYEAGDGWGMKSGQVKTLTPKYKVRAPGGDNPYSASFSPNGSKIALGYRFRSNVSVLSGYDLSYLYTPSDRAVDGDFRKIIWSSDGTLLFAGGEVKNQLDGASAGVIRRWSQEGRGEFMEIPVSLRSIIDMASLPEGGVVFGSIDPAFGIVTKAGDRSLYLTPATADFRYSRDEFLLANDGKIVRFGFEATGKSQVQFDLSTRQLTFGGSSTDFISPVTYLPGFDLTDWKNAYTPKLNRVPLKLDEYERSQCLALAPDGQSVVIGTNWYLRCFDKIGQKLWQVPAPDEVWGVNISGSGKVVVATFADGTIRWFRLEDGKELLAFFPHVDRKRWVLWTPSGYYDASVGGEDLIGWQVNRGKDKAADFFPASRFRNSHYRPGVIARILTTLDEDEALRLAKAARKAAQNASTIREILPPVVDILDLPDGSLTTTSHTVKLRYRVRSPADAPVTDIRAQVNTRPAPVAKGLPAKFGDKNIQEISITIPEEDCEIGLIAENHNALSVPATIRVIWKGKATVKALMPRLLILAIGVGAYEEKELKLNYSAKDAKDFFSAFKQQEGVLYSKVESKVITDSNAKKDDILDGLDWLKKEATNKDIAIIFLSGHGVNDQAGLYYFLPQNAVSDNLTRTGLELSTIKNTVANLPGKVLLFIDTCHAGNVDLNGIVNALTGSGVGAVVFASSTGSQKSLERDDWKNGAFTKALVEGLNGKADYQGKGKITITSLDLYVSDRVKELTDEKQTPVVGKPTTIADFPIAGKK